MRECEINSASVTPECGTGNPKYLDVLAVEALDRRDRWNAIDCSWGNDVRGAVVKL
jgi:hypothetical protein